MLGYVKVEYNGNDIIHFFYKQTFFVVIVE